MWNLPRFFFHVTCHHHHNNEAVYKMKNRKLSENSESAPFEPSYRTESRARTRSHAYQLTSLIITDICYCRSMGNSIAFNFNWDIHTFFLPSSSLLHMAYTFRPAHFIFTFDFVNLLCIVRLLLNEGKRMKNWKRFIFMKIMKLKHIAMRAR